MRIIRSSRCSSFGRAIELTPQQIRALPTIPVEILPAVEGMEIVVHDFNLLTMELDYEIREEWPEVIGE